MVEQTFWGPAKNVAGRDIINLPEGMRIVVCLHVPMFWALAVAWIYAACC